MIGSGTNAAVRRMIEASRESYRPFLAGLAAYRSRT